MRFLLTNDDGIDAVGLRTAQALLADWGEVVVVAPTVVRSACGHGVTFHRALEVQRRGERRFAVAGKPSDCVKLGLKYLCDGPVDVVVSGINAGANIGVNVWYSGTVAAAREAAILGVPAVALSVHIGDPRRTAWAAAGRCLASALRRVLEGPLRGGELINLNAPILDDDPEPVGVVVAPLSTSPLVDHYDRFDDGGDTLRFEVGSTIAFRESQPGTDVDYLFRRYVTVTPMHVESTDHGRLGAWAGVLEGCGARA